MSIVHKTETRKPAGRNRLTFVLSDATVDRYGDTIDPHGWDLSDFRNNPIALFGHDGMFPVGKWANVRVEKDQLLADLIPAQKGTSARIDEIVSLVEQDILRTVSVGFKPIEYEPRKGGGINYKKQSLLECSVVGVPANPAALAVAKSLHVSPETIRMAFGEHAEGGQPVRAGSPGEKAAPKSPIMKGATMKTLSQRIEDAQADLVREKDALAVHVAEDDADPIVTEELSTRIEQKEAGLAALKRAESALAVKTAAPVAPVIPAAPARRPHGAVGKDAAPRDLIFRSAAVFAVSASTGKDALDVMERMYGDDEGTGIVVKAAVAGATTAAPGWAAELVNTAMTDFLETLRPQSVYPALAAAGGGRLAFGPNQGAIKIPSRAATPSIGGSFVGEGAPIPVRRLGLTSITLSPKKMGVISVFSREIARYSTPAIEALIRNEIIADTAITLDSLLLDASAGSAVRPAGLLNGVTPLAATTGGGHAAILGDIRKLQVAFDAVNASGNIMLLMNPAQALALELTPGPDGTLGWARDIMARYRVTTSTAIPAGQIIAIRADDFVTATGDVPEFETSNEATIHLEDTTPAQIGTAGTPAVVAAPVQSMFQTAQTAIRMLLDVSWALRRAGMVQTITAASW